MLRNSFVEQYTKSGLEPLAFPLQRIAAEDIYSNAQTKDNADYYPLYSEQGLRMLKRGQSAEDIVKEIVTEANEYLSLLSKDMEMH